MKKLLLLFLFFLFMSLISIAQVPIISYGSSATYSYILGTAITPLVPVNTGGSVSQTCVVSTEAGNGTWENEDGIGTAASIACPGSMSVDISGNIYALDACAGRVRKITTAGVVSTSNNPYSVLGVAVDTAGNLYMSDMDGNRIIKEDTSGVISIFAGSINGEYGSVDGIGTSARFSAPRGLACDIGGNIYVTEMGSNLIRKITPTGVVTTLAGSGNADYADGTGTSASFNYPAGIVVDISGNVYVADLYNNRIRKITPAGVVTTLAGSGTQGYADGTGTSASFNYPYDITVDAFGNVYLAESNNNRIRKITSAGVVTTIAGSGDAGYLDGVASEAQFSSPSGITVDNRGNLYISDFMNHRVRKMNLGGYHISRPLPSGLTFDPSTGTISGTPLVEDSTRTYTISASNSSGTSTCQITIGVVQYMLPSVVSHATTNIRETTAIARGTLSTLGVPTCSSYGFCWSSTNTLPTIADSKIDKGAANATGDFTASFAGLTPGTLYYARAYAINNAGIAYGNAIAFNTITPPPAISYASTSAVVQSNSLRAASTTPPVITPGTSVYHFVQGTAITPLVPISTGGTVPATIPDSVSTFAGNGNYGYADGTGTSAMFSSPYGISADAENNVYIADWGNYRVRKITPVGVVSTLAGNGTSGYADGTGTSAIFSTPIGVVAEGYGNVYVADYARIRKINSTGVVSTLAGNGTIGYVDGTATAAKFGSVSGVTIDGAGNVYVADQTNNRIRKITPAGVVTTLAGSGAEGSADGIGTAASFNMPWGVATDTANNVYVSDQGNNKIRKITPAGVVTTFAGSGTQGSADGTGTAATFNSPIGITTDEAGNVYVSDYENSKIRKITQSGVVTTMAGSGNQDYADGVGSSATFNYPTGLAMDKLGNLYVVDPGNNRIRRITIGGYKISPALPAGLSFDPKTGIISGTPTVLDSLGTVYTITAINLGGESSYQITIGVGKLAIDSMVRVTNPTETTATVTGNISYLGWPDTPTSYGICWSATDTLPTIANSKIDKGAATVTGNFTTILTGLTPGTLYYARAYVVNNEGVSYSSMMPFNTKTTPPAISYGSASIHYLGAGSAIIPLAPTNTGGAVPATIPDSAFQIVKTPPFDDIVSLMPDAFGNMYALTETKILKITPAGVVSTYLTLPFTNMENGIMDEAGNIYAFLVPGNSSIIKKITPSKVISTVAELPYYCTGLASDTMGNFYVAKDYSILKMTPSGVVSTLAGSGTPGYADGAGAAAQFADPVAGLTSDGSNIYVSDESYDSYLGFKPRIRTVSLSGTVSTLAGSGTQGSVDGVGTSAQFVDLWWITTDLNNNIYVFDNGKIRKVTSSGVVTTIAGRNNDGYDTYLNYSGVGTSLGFPIRGNLAVDTRGNLFFGDLNGNIAKMNLCGYKISPTTLPAGLYFDRTTGIISGTPTAIDSTRTYTVTAINPGGESSTTLRLKVAQFPAITTQSVCNISGTMAIGRGTLTALGTTATAYGVCWSSTNTLPTVANSKTNKGVASAAGTFFTPITGLIGGTQYYVRAYASIGENTVYGNVVSFTTLQLPNISYGSTPSYSYSQGVGITPVEPTNSGSVIPEITTNTVTNILGYTGDGDLFYPQSLATDTSGNIYVADYMFLSFSPNNCIRKITPSGVASILAGGSPGYADGTGSAAQFNNPTGVCSDPDGNFYVADYNNHRIRKITSAGAVTTLAGGGNGSYADGTGTLAAFYHPSAVAVDPAGYVYVADQGNNRIRKITPAGVVTTLAGSGTAGYVNGTGTSAQFGSGIAGITTDTAGNVYVADTSNHVIRKITPAGVVSTFAGSGESGYADGTGTSAKFKQPMGLTMDVFGNMYVADVADNRIRKITPAGVVTTIAGNGTLGTTRVAVGTNATFYHPMGIAADQKGNLYVSDQYDFFSKIALGGYSISPALPAGLSLDSKLGVISGMPTGVSPTTTYTITASNNTGTSSTTLTIQVGNNTSITTQGVSRITPTSASVKGAIVAIGSHAPTASGVCWSSTNTSPTIANSHTGVAFSSVGSFSASLTGLTSGTVYYARAYAVVDTGTVYGGTVMFKTIIPPPVINYGQATHTYTLGTAIQPISPVNTGGAVPATVPDSVTTFVIGTGLSYGICSDVLGNFYTSAFTQNKIYKLTSSAVSSVLAGTGTNGYANGSSTSAKFSIPKGIVVDAVGNVYVADGDGANHRVRTISASGMVSTLAGNSTSGSADGVSSFASFAAPQGTVVDTAGNIYVSDGGNYNIRKITPAGVVSTFAGSGTAGYADGTGTSAQFYSPKGLALDTAGNFYVVDGQVIRKITSAGVVTTLAGSSTAGYADGTGTAARFNFPWGITTDVSGNVYVADNANNRVRKITPSGVVSTLIGTGKNSRTNGIGTAASLLLPVGVTVDPSGNLYISEAGAVRKVTLGGYKISPALPAGLSFDRTTGTISGTPTVIDSIRTYTITAINLAGTSTSQVTLGVGRLPTVTTRAVTNVTGCTATGNGVLSSTGFPVVSAYGICWSSTNAMPTIADKKVNHGAATDTVSYSFLMTRLSPNTLYYARAYAVNSAGVVYGDVVSFTTAQLPIISYPASTYHYAVGKAITSLVPINSGGIVPAVAPGTVTTLAGGATTGYLDGTGAAARFNILFGITTDPAGNIYVSDALNHRIRKVTPSGIVTTFAGDGSENSTDGIGTSASTYYPVSICSDMLGNLYVGESATTHHVRKITPAAVVSTISGFTPQAVGMSVDYNSNLYAIDASPCKVYKRDTTGVVSVLAGSGTFAFVDGSGTAASFRYLCDLATDTAGNAHVIDGVSIRKITPSGVVSTVAGIYTSSGYVDGSATSARFSSPQGLTADAVGNTYIADASNRRIRKINPAGFVTTLAGSATSGYTDGIGTAATFTYPERLTVDAFGNLYVTDKVCCIRKVTLLGYYIYPALPAGLSFDATTGTISGTPTGVTTTQTYTVTAKNVAGESSYMVSIGVDQLPTVTTQSATSIKGTTATGNGNITSLGSPNPYAYGVCWSSTDTLPTIANSKVNKGATTATGAYTCAMTGLSIGTKYYVRAYATDSAGTTYGNAISFTTAIPAGVSTQAVSSITQTSAVANATLSSLGSPITTSYGICWSSTNTLPTVSDNIISKGIAISTGAYTCAMSNLSASIIYYVRAYATNTSGTSYGDVVTFSTAAATKQLSVKIYLEGLLTGTSTTMNQCTTDGSTPEFSGAVDTLSIELHNASTYSTVEYRVSGLYLNQDGSIHASGKTYIEIPGTYTGSYYITVKTRNHLKTTSVSTVSFTTTAVSYDFTTAANKAYGSKMKSMNSGVFALYAGDVNQDGSINTTDESLVSDANFTEGYSIYDLTGDGLVDNADVSIVSSNLGIVISHP